MVSRSANKKQNNPTFEKIIKITSKKYLKHYRLETKPVKIDCAIPFEPYKKKNQEPESNESSWVNKLC